VPDEQLSLAIGRKGQNVRLASQLTGWDIDILTEAEESERRQKEFAERTNTFVNALNVDEMIAQLLVSEGFASVEELAFVEPQEVANIEGFDENTAQEIQERAREYLERQEAELTEKRRALGVEDALAEVEGVTASMLVTFGENGIKTVEDLADCSTDELAGWQERAHGQTKQHPGILQSHNLAKADIEQLILSARVKAGWIEAPQPVEASAGDEESEGGEAPNAEPKEKAD
jgi:N utilization substance protein A